jgi:hypothetical protein
MFEGTKSAYSDGSCVFRQGQVCIFVCVRSLVLEGECREGSRSLDRGGFGDLESIGVWGFV